MRFINGLDQIFFNIAKLGMLICVFLTTANAAGRFLFNKPITGAYEFTENYLMVIMVFLSLGITWKTREFIAVTFLSDKFPENIKNIVYFLILVLGIAFFSLIAYEGYLMTYEALIKKQTTSGIVQWPIYTSKMWVPLGSIMIVLRMLLELVIGIKSIRKKGFKSDLFSDFNV